MRQGRLSLDDGLISQTSTARTCIGRRKKNRISAWRTFHQFPSALTDHNRTSTANPNIGDDAGSAILIYAIRRRTYYRGAPAKFSIGKNSSRFAARQPMQPTRPISHIIRPSIDSYVNTPLRFAGKLAHDWSLFKASHNAAASEIVIVRNCARHIDVLCQKMEGKLTKSNGAARSKDPSVLCTADWKYLT